MNVIKDCLDIGPGCEERFIDSSILAEMKSLEITLAGCSNLVTDYRVARAAPLEHTLFYTLDGQGKLTTYAKEYLLEPNSLAILPSKQGFEVSIAANHWDVFWLNLANTKRWQHVALDTARVMTNQKLEPLHFALELLYSEPNAALRNGVEPIITHYLSTTLRGENQNEAANRLHKLFKDVERRLQYDWTIDAMCNQLHYSAPHLHRLCQTFYGISPIQKLIQLRMERAKILLLNTRWPVQHIASYVGYANIFNFSKSFKKYSGISPSCYRQGKR